MLSSNPTYISHTVTCRKDAELDAKLKQLPAWELATYLGESEAGRPLKSLAPLVDSKSWKEDQGDIYEDGGHMYDRVKCFMERAPKPEPVLTCGTEDAILIVSNLCPPCLKHGFSYPQQPHLITNVTVLQYSSLFQNIKASSFCGCRRRKSKS